MPGRRGTRNERDPDVATRTVRGYDRETGAWPTLRRTVQELQEDNLTDWAAALTYYGVLAIFPALLALVSLVGLVYDPEQIVRALTEIVGSLGPQAAVDAMTGPIEGVANQSGGQGIALLVVGVAGALWSASGYVGGFMRASNVMYEADEGRPIWKLRPLQMLVTLGMVVLLALAALAVVVTGPLAQAVGGAIGMGDTAVLVWDIVKWPVLVLVVLLMLSVLYYAAPNAKLAGFRFVTVGSLVAVAVWIVASLLFALYVANFGSYDRTYGTLGGIIGFLVWFWITNLAVLLGAELNAERERSREFEAGVPGAEQQLQQEPRDEVPEKKQRRTG